MNSRTRDQRRHRGLTVEVKNDDVGRALRFWSKKVQETGLLKELRDRMAYEKPTIERKRKKQQARKRWEREVEEMIDLGLWHRDKNY